MFSRNWYRRALLALWALLLPCGLVAQQLHGRTTRDGTSPARALDRARQQAAAMAALPRDKNLSPAWIAVGPAQVASQLFGAVTGRVTSLVLDPADSTGNTLYVGTTGGGVWKSTNAAGAAPTFVPLTDSLPVFAANSSAAALPSLSIGALGMLNGVLLAGTGDPNDASDSYYGAGILRSADAGPHLDPRPANRRRHRQQPQLLWCRRRRPRLFDPQSLACRRRGRAGRGRLGRQRAGCVRRCAWAVLLARRRPHLEDRHRARRHAARAAAWPSRQRCHRGRLGRASPAFLRRRPVPRLLPVRRRRHLDPAAHPARRRAHRRKLPHPPWRRSPPPPAPFSAARSPSSLPQETSLPSRSTQRTTT